jgi:hypothetical protein
MATAKMFGGSPRTDGPGPGGVGAVTSPSVALQGVRGGLLEADGVVADEGVVEPVVLGHEVQHARDHQQYT